MRSFILIREVSSNNLCDDIFKGKIVSSKNGKISPQISSRKLNSSDKAPKKHSSLVMDEPSNTVVNKGVNLSSKF